MPTNHQIRKLTVEIISSGLKTLFRLSQLWHQCCLQHTQEVLIKDPIQDLILCSDLLSLAPPLMSGKVLQPCSVFHELATFEDIACPTIWVSAVLLVMIDPGMHLWQEHHFVVCCIRSIIVSF